MNNNGFSTFSKKQLIALTWWHDDSAYCGYDGIICDGAVRSGKTTCMSISFIAWAFYRFSDADFALCGKTITSLRRNIITPLLPILDELGFKCSEKRSQNLIEISLNGRVNRFYIFGGRDESSAALIQGMTLTGVLLDEVALMPRSFVEQALARCSPASAKYWFNCNPENPLHWFFEEWIKKAESKNCLYLHFLMKDNPSLSPKVLKRYESLYSGAFYERFVLGKWAATDGLIYPEAAKGKYTFEPPDTPAEMYCISCDYGTVNPMSMGLWAKHGSTWFREQEYYYASREQGSQKTDEEYYSALRELVSQRKIEAVIVDPSAASFIECIRRHGEFKVIPAKNDVVDGIHRVHEALKDGKIKISPSCKSTLKEFALYRWDNNVAKDTPKKENDHAMDDIRYFVATYLNERSDTFFAVAAHR
ncbi:MAG: PBSX family phage terminase large subunit [Faecalibacterium sp.]|nr:PBSX family phage terminase large subunit [Ruminococcus sp.]MCM1392677.1 PBSX family phage terminase large subunit [Ruminococcus sp.]MCM1486345.1 PBSX family phage terminase large subunit [Faecalibacterium sp.]